MSHLYVNSEESQAFDFEEHMAEVRSMFGAMEIENGEAGKGIKYGQFLELLQTKLLQTFENDEFEDYCSKLDAADTGRILFDNFHEMLVNCEEET
jgi:Ca2+-binding EF-hand superfamily protein